MPIKELANCAIYWHQCYDYHIAAAFIVEILVVPNILLKLSFATIFITYT